MPDIEALKQIAVDFRRALEETQAIELLEDQVFPEGCCGDASLLLGTYLIDQGHGTYDYVLGMRGDRSHAWIQKDGLIIDITADQFHDMDQAIIVAADSVWHRTFEPRVPNAADFRIYDDRTKAHLDDAYQMVLEYMQEAP